MPCYAASSAHVAVSLCEFVSVALSVSVSMYVSVWWCLSASAFVCRRLCRHLCHCLYLCYCSLSLSSPSLSLSLLSPLSPSWSSRSLWSSRSSWASCWRTAVIESAGASSQKHNLQQCLVECECHQVRKNVVSKPGRGSGARACGAHS